MKMQTVAQLFVKRSEALGYKGKRRDAAAVEFFMGAYAGAHTAANGDAAIDAEKYAQKILNVTVMLICTRGYAEVVRIAEGK